MQPAPISCLNSATWRARGFQDPWRTRHAMCDSSAQNPWTLPHPQRFCAGFLTTSPPSASLR